MIYSSKHFYIALLAATLIHAMAFIHLPWPGLDVEAPKISKVINLQLDAGGGVLWNRMKDQDNDYIEPVTPKELSKLPLDQKIRLQEKQQQHKNSQRKAVEKSKHKSTKQTAKQAVKKKQPPKDKSEWQSVSEAVKQIERQVGTITPVVSQAPPPSQPSARQSHKAPPEKLNTVATAMTRKEQQLVRYTQAIALWYNKYQVMPETSEHVKYEHVRVPVRILVDQFGNVLQFMILKPIEQGVLEEVVMKTLNAVDAVPAPPVELFDNVVEGQPVAFEFALHYW